MDEYDSSEDAEDHPIQDFQGNDMAAGGTTNGERCYKG